MSLICEQVYNPGILSQILNDKNKPWTLNINNPPKDLCNWPDDLDMTLMSLEASCFDLHLTEHSGETNFSFETFDMSG